MRRAKKKNKLNSDMNIVPYVDVMFVLLTIFMVTATTVSVGIDVDPPKIESSQSVALEGSEMMVISVNNQGDLFFNQADDPLKSMTEDEIRSVAEGIFKGNPEISALVKGDAKAPYGRVIEAMALLQRITQKNVSLVTLPVDQ